MVILHNHQLLWQKPWERCHAESAWHVMITRAMAVHHNKLKDLATYFQTTEKGQHNKSNQEDMEQL
eukprot:12131288-Prorocentrum_lima.AAC.1